MPSQLVELKGAAITGLFPPGRRAQLLPMIRALPARVKLGRKSPAAKPRCPALLAHLDIDAARVALPASTNWAGAARVSIGQIFGNDQWGDCVVADRFHSAGTQSANDTDSGGEIVGTTDEAVRAYHTICGPGDDGCVIEDVLAYQRQHGITMGGTNRKIDGWVAVDWTNSDLVRWSVAKAGGCVLGINLPSAWLSSDVWDMTGSPVVGGHDVWAVDYQPDGLIVCSWGRLYRMTWNAVKQARRLDESYAVLAPQWYGDDGLAASGLRVEQLRADLATLAGGHVPPDEPPPGPPPPPPPPGPPAPPPGPAATTVYDVALSITSPAGAGTISGSITPRAGGPVVQNKVALTLPNAGLARALADLLVPVMGIGTTTRDREILLSNEGLSPAQWQAIITAVLQIVAAIIGGQA